MANTIVNPIISGMVPDSSALKANGKFYVATSTFHWTPGIQIFESEDLQNWHLINRVLKNNEVHLEGTPTPAGIWAPTLSFDEKTGRYWLAYTHLLNMAGREFNGDSYVVWTDDITGDWSEPIYLTSIGYDPSLFHDDDGKHYAAILQFESRDGYQKPGNIVIAEVELTDDSATVVGDWKKITYGFTTRGDVEAPNLYKRNGYYYLMNASGGTGYGHGVEMGRSKNIFGPYEPNPTNEPIITSSPRHLYSLGDDDAGQFQMYNPNSEIQKSGHGSLIEAAPNEWYVIHIMARPLPGTMLCPLGREVGIQKVVWNEDGWLELDSDSNLALKEVPGLKNSTVEKLNNDDISENFEGNEYDNRFMAAYHYRDDSWVNMTENPGHLRIYGKHSLFSKVQPSILATRATSFDYTLETELTFKPDHYSETAGAGLYYDSNDWVYARLYYSESNDSIVFSVLQAKLGKRIEHYDTKIKVPNGHVKIKLHYSYGKLDIFYEQNNEWEKLEDTLDVTYLSDEGVEGEPGEIGGFTGLVNFIGAVDAYQHESYADFDYYKVRNY